MDSDTILIVISCARGLLFILDALDEKFPKVKPFTSLLGSILGGTKGR